MSRIESSAKANTPQTDVPAQNPVRPQRSGDSALGRRLRDEIYGQSRPIQVDSQEVEDVLELPDGIDHFPPETEGFELELFGSFVASTPRPQLEEIDATTAEVDDADSVREIHVNAEDDGPSSELERRIETLEEAPLTSALEGAPRGLPLASTETAALSSVDPVVVQRVVEFAALSRDASGNHELRLTLDRKAFGGLEIKLTSAGRGKVKISWSPGISPSSSSLEVDELVNELRKAGIDVLAVEEA